MTKVKAISTRDQGQEYKRLTLAECHIVAVFAAVSLIHTQSVFTWLNCFSSYKIHLARNALPKSHQPESKTCWRTFEFQTFIYLVLRHVGKSGRRQQLLPFFPSLTLIGKFSLWKVLVTLTMKMRSVTKIPPSSAATTSTSTPLRWSWQVWIYFLAFSLLLDWQLEMRGGSSPSLKKRREFRLVKRRQLSAERS